MSYCGVWMQMDTTSVTDEKYICFQVSVWIHSALNKKCVSTKEKVEKPIPMQIEQVRNWLVLLMIFAWDHIILSSHIYPGLRLLFHSGFWLKFSLHNGPVLCVYSLRLYSLLESFVSGWKRSQYNASPGIILDIMLPAIFQRECRPCSQWSKSERMFVWNTFLSACRLYPGLAVNAV
jgi:hypothetical protein